jgi:hypothetical protein
VRGKLERAATLIERAASSPAKQARKLLKRAKKALKQAAAKATRAAKGRKPKLSADCAKALRDAAQSVVQGLGV